MSNSILDFIGETQINPDTDWMKLTDLVKMLFVEKSHLKFSRNLDVNDAGNECSFVSCRILTPTAVSWVTVMGTAIVFQPPPLIQSPSN